MILWTVYSSHATDTVSLVLILLLYIREKSCILVDMASGTWVRLPDSSEYLYLSNISVVTGMGDMHVTSVPTSFEAKYNFISLQKQRKMSQRRRCSQLHQLLSTLQRHSLDKYSRNQVWWWWVIQYFCQFVFVPKQIILRLLFCKKARCSRLI